MSLDNTSTAFEEEITDLNYGSASALTQTQTALAPAFDEITEEEIAELADTTLTKVQIVSTIRSRCDYLTGLSGSMRDDVCRATERIRNHRKEAGTSMIEIGKELNAVKSIIDHGEFGQWLQSEFDWAARTAQRFMLIAERFGDKPNVAAVLPQAALELLASKSAPTEAVKEIIKDIKAGSVPTTAEIANKLATAKDVARHTKKAEAAKQSAAKMTPKKREACEKVEEKNAEATKNTDSAEANKMKDTAIKEERHRKDVARLAKSIRILYKDYFLTFKNDLEELGPGLLFKAIIAAAAADGEAGNVIHISPAKETGAADAQAA